MSTPKCIMMMLCNPIESLTARLQVSLYSHACEIARHLTTRRRCACTNIEAQYDCPTIKLSTAYVNAWHVTTSNTFIAPRTTV